MDDILFGNNNKAVIKKLANRSFRSNKMRNVIAVIAIALTTFLFTAVLTIGMGAKGTLEYNMAKMIGTGADALVQGLSEEQFQQLKENSMFEKVGCWVPIEIMTNTNRMVAEIDYADQPQLELRMQTPRTGSAPQKANEVLVSANILKDLNIKEKIGAEIPIEFKNRQSGQMYHFDMIVSGIYDTPNKLANRSFRSNKMRNVIAVIAIALTTFLFTAVLTIGMGAKGTLEYNMAKMIGTGADALVQGLSEEQFQQLKENSMFEKVGCWVPIEIMTNTNRIFAEIDYADQPQLELRMQTPRTGSAPQKANEVLVSANILNDLNIEEEIGAEIPIEFKNRQSGQMYHFDMIVSGIYDTPNEKSESVIVSKAFMEENPEMMNEIAQGREGCGIYDADVIMRDSSMIKERISEFVRSIGGNPDDRSAENYVRVAPNTFLSNNSGGSIMWLVAGVFGVLFMFCGYLLIYNVFEIAVTNDIRQYGLLRTVGTTSQQIKRLVNRQALYLFLIGTPFGLLFGILLGRSILPAALQMFAADYSGKNIEVSTLPYLGIIAGAILFSGLTVYISTRKSVKKASRVSPIEAIRYVEQNTVSIKRKKTNTGAVIPRMAKANLQRNKRRTVFIVISLTLSIVLLNSVFIFSGSFDEDVYVKTHTKSDFAVYNPDIQAAWGDEFGHSCTVSEKSVEEIEQQPGVINEVRLYRNTFEDDHIACDWGPSFSIDNRDKYAYVLPDSLNLGWIEYGGDYAALTADNLPLGNVYGFSENLLNKMDIIEGERDVSVLKEKLWNGNNVILVSHYNDKGNLSGGADNIYYLGLSVGDTIQFYENGAPTEEFTVIAKAAVTSNEMTLTGGGDNIATDVGGPKIYRIFQMTAICLLFLQRLYLVFCSCSVGIC